MSRPRLSWRLLAATVAALAAATVSQAAAVVGASASSQPYYLSLGDSLAAGFQQGHITTNGYADDLDRVLSTRIHGLQFAKYGCPGETTGSMISGGCPAAALMPYSGSQLNAAVTFLATHNVRLITIDIGANDVDNCFSTPDPQACAQTNVPIAASHLGFILGTLRAVAPTVPIVGMSYYDPFLAAYLNPALGGPPVAALSLQLADVFNGVLTGVYRLFHGVTVADVAGAFHTDNQTMLPFLHIPTDVAVICTLTWMCVNQDIHANNLGYWVITGAFLAALPPSI